MTRFAFTGIAAVAIVSAASGWLVGHDQAVVPAFHAGAPPADARPGRAADPVQVPADGTVPSVVTHSAATPLTEPSADDAPDAVEALQALRGSDVSERVAALQQVRSGDAIVPAELLQQLSDSDPSEEIREEAFRALVELRSTDPDALHQLLETGLTSGTAAVRAESEARLAMYDQRRNVQAANVQP